MSNVGFEGFLTSKYYTFFGKMVACKGNSIQKLTFRITNPMQNKNTEKNIEIKFYNKCLKLLGSKCYQ